MDVYESSEGALHKHTVPSVDDTSRPPLKNAVTTNTRRPRTREVSSRYKSPTPSRPSSPRRCPSPNLTRTVPVHSQMVSKRALSAERKRPSTPPSPSRLSTPAHDSDTAQLLSRKMIGGGKLPESLWPSTMRSLSVSFQSDTISIPVSKKEKPAPIATSDRTLRPSSNVAHKQPETPSLSRKPTPERKRSPLKGKNAPDQSENSKPVDGLHTRLIDQHRWPSRKGGKVSSNSSSKTVDLVDKTMRSTSGTGIGLSSMRRMPMSDVAVRPLQKSVSDAARLLDEIGRVGSEAISLYDNPSRVSGPHKNLSTISSDRATVATPAGTSQLPTPGSRHPSPSSRTSSVTKGASPSRARPSTPPSRGVSPSRIRPSTSTSQSNTSTSVLSFIADFKRGKKGLSYIEDAHQLRLLYNRFLQWRFANARAEAVLYIQKATTEKTLYDVWNTTLSLWDSIIRKRVNLQKLKLELKLNSVLNDQMLYLDDWALLERDHINSLSGAVDDLKASTLRLPITGGARADIESLKIAVCSAFDVMQAMGSSICSLLSRVEGMNNLVSELAVVAAQEKTMLVECEALLSSTTALQVEEYSLRTHLIQMKQVVESGDHLILPIRPFPPH
ncbi:DUF566 domain-containing protein [Cephalotus follicularis]|uniref:DUF566 domain-containing protein n=1 Tax=Cephalotus follicularis TaxID=3775 RepID=A0A1Q3CC83_CEPFO|nr:DUF566 domain-containing protein [Cephalotus follicularis]